MQHLAYRMPVSGFNQGITDLSNLGFELISDVDHPNARMAFFDTYNMMRVATEIMGITPEGWVATRQMSKPE